MIEPIPRYHITDDLWKSFTVEGVSKTISTLSKNGFEFRHPAAFTVRLSFKALYDTYLDAGGEQKLEKLPFDNPNEELFFDIHHYGYDGGAVTGQFTPALFTTHRYSKVSISRRRNIPQLLASNNEKYLTMLRHWWEKDCLCVEWDMRNSEESEDYANFLECPYAKMTAHVLICCLYERTVRKIMVEPRKEPRSAIAKKLAARRGSNKSDTTPETILHIPKREYNGGHGGHHASPRLHYRNPHWRKQPYGPRGNPSYREVLIEGMFINAEDCTAEERVEVRMVRRFKLELAEQAESLTAL
jgi:hypothetical protein